MLKHFRVPGRLAVKLDELGVSVPDVLRRAGLPHETSSSNRACLCPRENSLRFGAQ